MGGLKARPSMVTPLDRFDQNNKLPELLRPGSFRINLMCPYGVVGRCDNGGLQTS
jgi:hypothetical protein